MSSRGRRGPDGRLRLAGGTLVTEVVCEPVAGRPSGVRYLRSDGTTGEQPAAVVVLANNAPYVAKLLLQSTSERTPTASATTPTRSAAT